MGSFVLAVSGWNVMVGDWWLQRAVGGAGLLVGELVIFGAIMVRPRKSQPVRKRPHSPGGTSWHDMNHY